MTIGTLSGNWGSVTLGGHRFTGRQLVAFGRGGVLVALNVCKYWNKRNCRALDGARVSG